MYPKILVPLDGTEASVAGLNEAIEMAKQQRGGTLRLLHVVVLPDPMLIEHLAQRQLDTFEQRQPVLPLLVR